MFLNKGPNLEAFVFNVFKYLKTLKTIPWKGFLIVFNVFKYRKNIKNNSLKMTLCFLLFLMFLNI